MKNETYDYTLTTAKSIGLMVVCAVVACGAGYISTQNHRGINLGAFELSAQTATILYAMIAVFSAWIAGAELFRYLRPKVEKLPIILDQDAIIAPPTPATSKPLRLTYKGISDIKSRVREGQRVLEIKHIEGNIHISGAAMESKDAFDKLWKSLESRVVLHRGYRY